MWKKILLISLFIALSGSVTLAAVAWYSYKKGTLQTFLVRQVANQIIPPAVDKTLLDQVLGYDAPRTYLVLFLNNTELRPGGGFIGSYAVVRFENGLPRIVKVEGSEIIDNFAPNSYFTPPAVLQKYLLIKKWQFRDSNWSPDFPTAASTSLAHYRLERGFEADKIDGLIAFTPTVVEELLAITGPIELAGEKYTSENFTKKLEYEVEFGFAEAGVAFRDRKQIMAELSAVILTKIRGSLFDKWSEYKQIIPRLFTEKHIMLYSLRPDEQRLILAEGWGGEMKFDSTDYLLWVDANLGALKTDAAVERSLRYRLSPSGTTYIGEVTMHYDHKGKFDKFTTRYRDYARVYLPRGSRLIQATGVMRGDRDQRAGEVATGIENGRAWFGGFISIEPGQSWDLTYRFEVAPTVADAIKNNNYDLLVQKQLGAKPARLTLREQFGTKVTAATPPETGANDSDTVYEYSGELGTDRRFKIQFQQ